MKIEDLKPQLVFKYFSEICKIPRGSGNEKQISDYLTREGKKLGLEVVQDEHYNVLIKKKATPGYENAPTVIIQGHMDMVCEKNKDTDHDFEKDPIKLRVEGNYLYATDTTLGADNGIAVAMGLALLASDNIVHPPLEVVFTADEEESMNGAMNLKGDLFKGSYIINLDSEEEGTITVSCAGGVTALVTIEKEFKEVIGNRIQQHIQVEYVYQEITHIPSGCSVPEGRVKPWGTGQAILACKGIVNEPFVIINADDYYGKVAFKKLHDFLIEDSHRNSEFTMAMAGFILKNTLSDNGTVTRGICVEDEAGYLHRVIETKGIIRNNQGTIDCDTEESKDIIQENNRVSMNMWAGYPCFIDYLENGFKEFLLDDSGDELTKEYLLPIIVDQLIKTNRASVKVLETTDKWFGVTYPEDKQIVQDSINELIEQGIYPEKLWK